MPTWWLLREEDDEAAALAYAVLLADEHRGATYEVRAPRNCTAKVHPEPVPRIVATCGCLVCPVCGLAVEHPIRQVSKAPDDPEALAAGTGPMRVVRPMGPGHHTEPRIDAGTMTMEWLGHALTLAIYSEKQGRVAASAVLHRLGIERGTDESALQAFFRHNCEVNGWPWGPEAHGIPRQLVSFLWAEPKVALFAFILAACESQRGEWSSEEDKREEGERQTGEEWKGA